MTIMRMATRLSGPRPPGSTRNWRDSLRLARGTAASAAQAGGRSSMEYSRGSPCLPSLIPARVCCCGGHRIGDPGECSMIHVEDLFEAHLTVTNLDRAIEFYRDVVGLRLAQVV